MQSTKILNLAKHGLRLLLVTAIGLPLSAMAQSAASECGSLANHYGPFDYRKTSTKLRALVENYHFTPQVEALIRGQSGFQIGPDISYTLRVFPNHPRALLSMMRYGQKFKSPQPPEAQYSIECYFERALRFQANDTVVRMLYATYLNTAGRRADAMQQLARTAKTSEDDPFTQYNVGLIYFDMKEYDKALAQAHIALSLGFPRTYLKEQLEALGKWRDAVKSTAPIAPVAPSVPASATQ